LRNVGAGYIFAAPATTGSGGWHQPESGVPNARQRLVWKTSNHPVGLFSLSTGKWEIISRRHREWKLYHEKRAIT